MSQDFGENNSIKNIKSENKNLNMSQDFGENKYIKNIKTNNNN